MRRDVHQQHHEQRTLDCPHGSSWTRPISNNLISNCPPNADSSNFPIVQSLRFKDWTNPHSGNHSKSNIRDWTTWSPTIFFLKRLHEHFDDYGLASSSQRYSFDGSYIAIIAPPANGNVVVGHH